MKVIKLLRITTVPVSLKLLLKDQLKFMNQYYKVVGVSSSGRELEDVKKEQEIRTIELDMSREITPVKDLVSLFLMTLLFLKEKPYIVHTHTPKHIHVTYTYVVIVIDWNPRLLRRHAAGTALDNTC